MTAMYKNMSVKVAAGILFLLLLSLAEYSHQKENCNSDVGKLGKSLERCVDGLELLCDTCPYVDQPVLSTCADVRSVSPTSPPGYYLLRQGSPQASQVFCNF